MSLLETIKKRRSIRAFLDLPVEEKKLQDILEAGLWAPSAGNLQEWKNIIVRDQKKKTEIAAAAFHQDWIAGAPVLMVVCAEVEKVKKYYGVRGERLYAIQDCAAAIQTMLLEAEAQGLASCWVGAFDEVEMNRALDIPETVRVQAIIALGYAGEQIPTPAKKELRSVVFFEKYGEREIKKKEVFPLHDSIAGVQKKFTEKASTIKNKLLQKQA